VGLAIKLPSEIQFLYATDKPDSKNVLLILCEISPKYGKQREFLFVSDFVNKYCHWYREGNQ
jgi:hypothetical protein